MQNFIPLFLAVSPAIVMQTRQELKMYYLRLCKIFVKVCNSWQQKMQQKSTHVYPPEIIKTSSWGRRQKKSLEHNDCLYVAFVSKWRVRKPNCKLAKFYRTAVLKVVSATFLLVCFFRESICETTKNIFYFILKAFLLLR